MHTLQSLKLPPLRSRLRPRSRSVPLPLLCLGMADLWTSVRGASTLASDPVYSDASGVVGLLQQRLLDLGDCLPLAVGAHGGVNREWHGLIGRLADSAAPDKLSSMVTSL